MILVDTSVWVDHLRTGDAALAASLEAGLVLTHPFVIGELALGTLAEREILLGSLRDLPRATVASDDEVLVLIEREGLQGRGIGYVDVHLLAAVRLTPDASLWTRDKRLQTVAKALSLTVAALR